MSKLITFAVPCYNSAAYMDHCVQTLLTGGEDIEIILVDDGSTKDDTPAICDRYAAEYPDIVRAIHQENGGHGEGVNQGLRNASGLYYKVVDSDDWLDEDGPPEGAGQAAGVCRLEQPVDLVIANYVYEHVEDNTQKVMRYTNVFPQEPGVHLERHRPLPPLPVPADALGDLPHRAAARLRAGAAQAHLLCGQHLRLPAPALGEEHVLHGRGSVPLLHRPGRPERQREGDGRPCGPAGAGHQADDRRATTCSPVLTASPSWPGT